MAEHTDEQPILKKGDIVLFKGKQLYVEVDYYANSGTVITNDGNYYYNELRKIDP